MRLNFLHQSSNKAGASDITSAADNFALKIDNGIAIDGDKWATQVFLEKEFDDLIT